MKKRILSILLAIALLLGMLTACGPALTQNGDVYEIKTAADLQQIAKDEDGNYKLLADIDMTGVDWKPIADFAGTLDGNGKTIHNLTIDESNGRDLGLFASVEAEGVIKDLSLENVTIHAEETKAENVGTFAGTLAGKMKNVTATGVIYDDRSGVNVGCLAGLAIGNADVDAGRSVAIKDAAGIRETASLAADVKMFVAKDTSRGLVGKVEDDAYVTGLWRDSFHSSERQPEAIQTRQEKATEYMKKMATVAWSVTKKMTHYGTADKKKQATNIHTQIFEPGETYYGIPYDHTSGSYERFVYCLDENGIMKDWVTEMGDSTWGGDLAFTKYMGNDCSAAVAWAWMQISPNHVGKKEGGAYVLLTSEMVPNINNQGTYGVYAVGSWNGEKFTEKGAAYSVMALSTTPEIFKANGTERMFEAYAQTRKADGLLFGNPGGHVRLVAEDPVVIRDGEGTIHPDMSYILCHEQGDGLYNSRYEDTNSSWRINYPYSFRVLAEGSKKTGAAKYLEAGSGNCYIPITIRALQDEQIAAPYVTAEIESPLKGKISSNYRIQSVQLTVKDSAGKAVYDEQAFVGVQYEYPDFRGLLMDAKMEDYHANALKNAAAGQYTYTVQVLLANGEIHMVAENAAYTHK